MPKDKIQGFEPDDTPLACATGKIRLFVDQPLNAGERIALPREQSHYLNTVMRARVGDPVLVFNGRDGEWRTLIETAGKRGTTLSIEALIRPQDQVPDLWLLFAPVKRARLDFLVQKATELGVSAIKPVFTHRTVVSRVNLERLSANVIEAAEQCGRLTVPEVLPDEKLDAVLGAWPSGRTLVFCDEAGEGAPLSGLAERPAGPAAILIGPEGGFDSAERAELLGRDDVLPISLGPRIMRADTAAIAALTLWQAVHGDLSG